MRGSDSVKLWMSSGNYAKVMSESKFEYGEHPFPMTVWNGDLDLHGAYFAMADSDVF